MKPSVNFTVLGGDQRMRACAEGLKALNFPTCDLQKPTVEELTLRLQNTDVLILPIPAFSGPLIARTEILTEQLLQSVPVNTQIFAGVVPEKLRERIIDYNLDEAFQLSGAVATAEGTIAILVNELPIALEGASCLIIGYGRIGKALASRLCALGMVVTVSARKQADFQAIEACSLRADQTGIYHHGLHYDCIINTVPAAVLSAEQLAAVPKNCLLVDLASKPGGLDWEACSELGLQAIHALGLPGKVAPTTSGLAIRDTVLNHLNLL